MAILIRFLFIALIVYLIYRFFRMGNPVRMTLTCRGVTKCKGVSDHLRKRLDEFAQEELLQGEKLEIGGYYDDNRRIRWVFPDDASLVLARRFRNFMMCEV